MARPGVFDGRGLLASNYLPRSSHAFGTGVIDELTRAQHTHRRLWARQPTRHPVYSICLVNGILWPDATRVHHAFRLADEEAGRVLGGTLEIHTLELGRYTLCDRCESRSTTRFRGSMNGRVDGWVDGETCCSGQATEAAWWFRYFIF